MHHGAKIGSFLNPKNRAWNMSMEHEHAEHGTAQFHASFFLKLFIEINLRENGWGKSTS